MQSQSVTMKDVVEDVKSFLGSAYIGDYIIRGKKHFILIDKNIVTNLAKYMKDKWDARLVHVTVSDLGVDGFEVAYHYSFEHIEPRYHIVFKALVSREDPKIDSITPITFEASWAEREMAELLGIKFVGHPDPRHLFLPYEWPEEVESVVKKENEKILTSIPVKPSSSAGSIIPIGPYHPMLVESIFFRCKVEDEIILDVDIKPGLNHRGIMQLAESRNYWRNLYLVERVCGICSAAHQVAYATTVENLFEMDIPDRARLIRTLIAELNRLHSHLLILGLWSDVMGFPTGFHHLWRLRENVLDIVEMICGNRVNYGMVLIGGVRWDVDDEKLDKAEKLLKKTIPEGFEIASSIADHPVAKKRLRDVGIVTRKDARDLGLVGPTARGSEFKIDVRKDDPYAAYDMDWISWDIVTYPGGDCYARFMVRVYELLQAYEICLQCIDALRKVGGPIQAEVSEPEPDKEGFGKVEAPRGELFYYLKSSKETPHIPNTVRIRTPSYRNNAALPFMLKGYTVADIPSIVMSIDPCYACTDRAIILENEKTRKKEVVTIRSLANK
ncbi:MAG: NADH-quinone oxidoreductase subunit C [Candidatus Baldrarchaeota archaeon]